MTEAAKKAARNERRACVRLVEKILRVRSGHYWVTCLEKDLAAEIICAIRERRTK